MLMRMTSPGAYASESEVHSISRERERITGARGAYLIDCANDMLRVGNTP
jgi:hypothetical protein